MNRERTDTEVQQAALVKALRSLMGIWPLLAILGTGASCVWYLSTQWSGIGAKQDDQQKTILWHQTRLETISASVSAQEFQIQEIDIHFARLEQMLLDLQAGRKTAISKLPQIHVMGSPVDNAGTGE
jgi:hypothetical protein